MAWEGENRESKLPGESDRSTEAYKARRCQGKIDGSKVHPKNNMNRFISDHRIYGELPAIYIGHDTEYNRDLAGGETGATI